MELRSSHIMSFKTRELQSLLVLVLSLAIAFTALASSQGIEFSFQTFNDSIVQCQGNATHDSSGFIQITEANLASNPTKNMGWATYHEPMRLWDKATGNVADFTTQFTFVINSENRLIPADGLTFFLVREGSQLPVNSSRYYLALVDPKRDPSDSSTSFVAIEFDTFYNNATNVVDPICSTTAHVGMDLNNLTSTVHSCVNWFNEKIMSGGRINAMIIYNSSTQNLSVLIIDADETGTNKNSTAIHDTVRMTKYLPEWVTFDFSAATGAFFELHTIEAWEFRSTVHVAGTDNSIPTNGTNVLIPANGDAKKSKSWLWSIVGSGSFILLILVLAILWFRHHLKSKTADISGEEVEKGIDEEFEQVSGSKKFTYKDLVAATGIFGKPYLYCG